MNTAYWNLFWTTGMPEAWLMSRGGEGPVPTRPGTNPGGWQSPPDGPLGFAPNMSDNSPGGPMGLY